MEENIKCKVESCLRAASTKGWCPAHYAYAHYHGLTTIDHNTAKKGTDKNQITQMIYLYKTGWSQQKIGFKFGIHGTTVSHWLRKNGITRKDFKTIKRRFHKPKAPKIRAKTYQDYVNEYNAQHREKPISLKFINWGGGRGRI